jgi:rhamnogalacturonyl hydrolase YesR
MLKSIEERGQSTLDAGGSTGYIQLALFWQALAVVTTPDSESKANEDDIAALRPLLETSLASTIPAFSNVTKDVEISLDRLSLGAEMIAWTLHKDSNNNATTDNATTNFLPPISNLATSLTLQPQNANGDYWYYNNVANLTAYRNLTYLDGMYSLAPFITLLPQLQNNTTNPSPDPVQALESALRALQSLHAKCAKPSGLLVHGYDAIKSHAWATATPNNTNGASPEVWSRSLGWYSLGLLNTLEIAAQSPEQLESEAYGSLRNLFQDVMRAQVQAVERSKLVTGVPGVWQVVDAPGEEGNFVEASGSFMTVYTLLRGRRLDFLTDDVDATTAVTDGEDAEQSCAGSSSIVDLAKEIYENVSDLYLISYANGSLSLNGTSSVASLSPQGVGYEYYITRPREVDSLIGTSAFALASWEVGRL